MAARRAVAPVHTVQGSEGSLAVLRRQLLAVAHELHARGWVANHDGNVTARAGGDRLLATPTALSKRVLTESDLIVVDGDNRVVQGGRRPFSEIALHRAVYASRADVRAVVHTHSPCAAALSVVGVPVEPRLIAEAVVSLGAEVPLIAYGFPQGADQLTALAAAAGVHDAVTLGNHGVLAWGDDVEQAFLRAELVEHLAHIQVRALAVGTLRTVPHSDVDRLLQARTKAGLGPAGRQK
ncbi:MAG: class II aldolase/adducin family protein [Deltaproteobacteria bacterium]|nr:class II aldolase/adducin family protein [Deltaproteobacteria bacterium]